MQARNQNSRPWLWMVTKEQRGIMHSLLQWVEYKQEKWWGMWRHYEEDVLRRVWGLESTIQGVQAVQAVQAVRAVLFRVDQNLLSLPELLWRVTLSIEEAYDHWRRTGDAEETCWHSCKVISILEYAKSVWDTPLASSNDPLPLPSVLTTHALPYLLCQNPSLSFAIYCNSWGLMKTTHEFIS